MRTRICVGLTLGQISLLLLIALNVGLTQTAAPRRCRKRDKETGKCVAWRRGLAPRRKEVAPFWKRGPPLEKVIAREGGNTRLDCNIRGFPKPSFSWNRNGRPLPLDKHKKYKVRRGKLFIRRIEQSDMATYTCVAENKLGSLNFSYYLAVLENMPLKDIDVVKRPENQTAQVGDTVTFMCRSQDWPKPPVLWVRTTKAGKIIPMLEYGNSSDVLVVHNVTKAHAGVFTCFIGRGSNAMKLDAMLTVIDQGESLPFEPQCSLHVRRQIMEDRSSGCRTEEPVDIHYCMGSCGRSYSIPLMVSSASSSSLNQTCSCCAGDMAKLRIVKLKCPLGESKRGFYTLLRGCTCRPCTVADNMVPTLDKD